MKENEISLIFTDFWDIDDIGSRQEQEQFILKHLTYSSHYQHEMRHVNVFYLELPYRKVLVCQLFLAHILEIDEKFIYDTLKGKSSQRLQFETEKLRSHSKDTKSMDVTS